ncbi:hypothetical protein Taro_030061 [Colocasia esculenta]|uniref:Malectin-like domain-containing protein n=1 Tax=Colocasia esculenta TaxID=4460 RepID=A0A843VT01_COLES|nr:hypothetical protein [Colocasia esculenta]
MVSVVSPLIRLLDVAASFAIYGHLLALLACRSMTPSAAQPGFLSLSCGGGTANFIGPPGLSWIPDSGYVGSGNTSTVNFPDGSSSASLQVPLRFFPSSLPSARNCYRLPVPNATLVLVRAYFYYKDYDGNGSPPIFQVSLGTAVSAIVNLTKSDPWSEEFVWPVNKDTLSLCLLPVVDASFNIELPLNISGLKESPPLSVLQTGRILARKSILTYYFPLDKMGDYYVVLYFAGILPVFSVFDIIINGALVTSNCTVKRKEANTVFHLAVNVNDLNITLRNVSFYPQISALEIYEAVEIPLECSSTTVSALEVIQQSTGFDLGWQDDPCSPIPWRHIGCRGNRVTSLNLSFNELTSFGSDFVGMLSLQIL